MIYASEEMCKSDFGKKLQYWRCERPDEWTMDEFIGEAEKLAEENAQLKAKIENVSADALSNYYENVELKARIAELEKPIAKIAILAEQLKLAKASTYHNRMGKLIEEVTGISLEKRKITKSQRSTQSEANHDNRTNMANGSFNRIDAGNLAGEGWKMKAELTKDGYIRITAETIVEAWALNGVWPVGIEITDRIKNQDRVIVDCTILNNEVEQ